MTQKRRETYTSSTQKKLMCFSLIAAISGCAVTDRIEPNFPISDDPTAAETAVGVGIGAVLVATAVLMFALAAAVNDAAS